MRFLTRTVPPTATRNVEAVQRIAGLDKNWIPSSIEATHATLDSVDEQLVNTGSLPLAEVVEKANLSAIVGNLLRSALQGNSGGIYRSSGPHKFPDLLSESDTSQDLEIKIALGKNSPKGHLPKGGTHLICRYVLGGREGNYSRGDQGNVVWIWEVRLGELSEDDFNTSNTPGDSGKTAVIGAEALKRLTCVYFDGRFSPVVKPLPGHD